MYPPPPHPTPTLYTELVIQSEHSLVICSLEAIPPRRRSRSKCIPLSLCAMQGVRTHKSQCAPCPVCLLMVPAYARDAAAASSLVIMPVGCFRCLPLPASHAHVSISLSVVCSHAVVPNSCLCLLPPASFPRCQHMYRGRGGARRRQWGNSAPLWVVVFLAPSLWASLPLSCRPPSICFSIRF